MGSTRLPNKSFAELRGKSSLEHLLDSLCRVSKKDDIYIATSSRPENDVIRSFANDYGVKVYSGDEENVASRFYHILNENPECSCFFRICGDTPLYDHRIIEKGLDFLAAHPEVEIATSMVEKGYPQGMNLELLKADVFKTHYQHFTVAEHYEHVTRYFYERIEKFNTQLVCCDIAGYYYEKYKFSIDTVDDYERAKRLFACFQKPHYEYTLEEKCSFYDETERESS